MHRKNVEVWTVGWTNQASVVGNFNVYLYFQIYSEFYKKIVRKL